MFLDLSKVRITDGTIEQGRIKPLSAQIMEDDSKIPMAPGDFPNIPRHANAPHY